MQALDPCSGLARVSSVNCGTNAGWFVDLMSSAICATLVVFLLLRPHLYVIAPVAVWSFVAFMANFFMKSKGLDVLATGRMAFYFLVFVGAGVLLVIDGQSWIMVKWARRPGAQPWAGQPYPGQYPPQPGYAVPPQQVAPPAPPAPHARPAAPKKK
jgi:hypothetical protein